MTTVAIWHCIPLKQNNTICFLVAVQREMLSTGSCFHLQVAQWLDKRAERLPVLKITGFDGEGSHS